MAQEVLPERGGRPLIGVTPRWFPAQDIFCAGESVGDVFMDGLLDAGAMPVMVPITSDRGLIREYVELCDGFVIPGGHNVDPVFWGEEPLWIDRLSPQRDGLELPLVEMLLERDKPLLGICRGAQVLNVVLGGSLVQDLTVLEPQGRPKLWKHETILDVPAHPIDVAPGSLLHDIVGADTAEVNSSHTQCVATLGAGVVVTGRATDGIVEAIEVPDRRFCLGVQWHPEYTWELLPHDRGLFHALVDAARVH